MICLKKFYDQFFDELNEDELRTIFYAAKQKATNFLSHPVCGEFPTEDAHIMSLSLGVALEILQRYENQKGE